MAGYLLDTNHLGQAVTRTSTVRKRLEEARKAGERLGTCVPALCEIEAGVQQVRYPEEYLARQMRLTLLTTDRDFEALPEVRTDARRTGRSRLAIPIALDASDASAVLASLPRKYSCRRRRSMMRAFSRPPSSRPMARQSSFRRSRLRSPRISLIGPCASGPGRR